MSLKNLTIFFAICCLFPQAICAQQKADGIIWSEIKLTWDNFQEDNSVEKYPGILARTYTKLYVTPVDTTGYVLDGGVSVKVYALMIPSISWVRQNTIGKNSVLAHEQLHFDIVELIARRLRKELSELKVCCNTYENAINKIKKQYFARLRAMQKKYDDTHKKSWQRWVDEIANGLAELKDYSSPEVFISIYVK